MALNEKEKKFAEEYLIDLNATQAAIRAGYSKQNAPNSSRWLDPKDTKNHKPELAAYIQARLEEMRNKRTADAQEVLEYLTSVMRGEQQEAVLRMIDGTQEKDEIRISTRDRLKAAELIGKRFGMFVDKTDLNIAQPIVISGSDQLED